MTPSGPHQQDASQVIYDPVSKKALIIALDQVIAVPGRFQNYNEAFVACRAVIDGLSRQETEQRS
jgi:hypothetical protein